MKVIIAGSRSIKNYDLLLRVIRNCNFNISEVVSGGARGVDLLGERYGREMGIPVKTFSANWNGGPNGTLDRSAGIKRNMQMGHYADALIALWDGESKGTEHMLNFMKSLGKPYYLCCPEVDEIIEEDD